MERPKTRKQILLAAARLLSKSRFCKHASALNKSGDIVEASSPDAVAFCTSGALLRASYPYYVDFNKTARYVVQNLPTRSLISEWNDRPQTKKKDVIALFRRLARQL